MRKMRCSAKCGFAVSSSPVKISSSSLKSIRWHDPQRQHYCNLTGSAAKIVACSSGSVSSTPCLDHSFADDALQPENSFFASGRLCKHRGMHVKMHILFTVSLLLLLLEVCSDRGTVAVRWTGAVWRPSCKMVLFDSLRPQASLR